MEDKASDKQIFKTHVKFQAFDGYQLTGTLFSPMINVEIDHPLSDDVIRQINEQNISVIILLGSATGTKRKFYSPMASYLASNGCIVLTYDNRGIGDSAPQTLVGFKSSITDWGIKDMPAALDWLWEKFGKEARKLAIIGNSVSGHIVGMLPNLNKISKLVTISSQNAHWNFMPANRYYWWLNWKIIMPMLTWFYGYHPSKKLGLFDDLPADFMYEWCKWSLHPDYMCQDPEVQKLYDRVKFPILSYSFSDDKGADFHSIYQFHRLFRNAPIYYRHIKPSEMGVKSIGHMGYFFTKFESTLWKETLDFLLYDKIPKPLTAPPSKL